MRMMNYAQRRFSSVASIPKLSADFQRIKNRNLLKNTGFVDGKWTASHNSIGFFEVLNPANGKCIVELPRMVGLI